MVVVLSDEARQYIALFEDVTGATARDCVIFEADDPDGESDEEDRVIFLVKPGDMGQAIGSGGETVRKLEDQLGKEVMLVEDADTPEAFVANALAPAAVHNVTISENDTTVAYVEVAEADKGVAIGKGGQNIEIATTLSERHFGIDEVQLA